MPHDPDTRFGAGGGDRFPSTQPSLVEAAAAGGEPSRLAMDDLVAVYWRPVYKYIRRKWKRSNDEAKDLTQGFLASLLERGLVGRYDRERGPFRTYLRTCVDGFVSNEASAAARLKRGGGRVVGLASLDFDEAGREFEVAAPGPSPEEYFLQEWQREMFRLAVADLRAECASSGKAVHFRLFELYHLCADPETRPTYAHLAAEHGLAETAVTNYLAFGRRRLRELVLRRLAGVTAGERELREEARRLLGGG